jgi:hypothetical protein
VAKIPHVDTGTKSATVEERLRALGDEFLLEDFAKALRVLPRTVSNSPAYRLLPRRRLGGRSYVRLQDALAFVASREFTPATRMARKRLAKRRGALTIAAPVSTA